MSDESLEFIKAITHGDIPKLKALAPLYAAKFSKNYQNLMHNIGHGLGHPENHEVLTILHDYVGQDHLMDAIEGAIDGDNIKSFVFLLNSPRLDITKCPRLLPRALGEFHSKEAALLLVNNANISCLTNKEWDLAIDSMLKHIPYSTTEEHKRWYQCLPSINNEDTSDFSWACKHLDVKQLPKNVVNLIKEVGNADISISLIEKGFAFDDLALGYNKDCLPELDSKYLELLTKRKLSKPTTIHAPKITL